MTVCSGSGQCADVGDGPWDAQIPQPAQEEIKAAHKGTVHSMADSPWW